VYQVGWVCYVITSLLREELESLREHKNIHLSEQLKVAGSVHKISGIYFTTGESIFTLNNTDIK
jgi:hypothetical protein